MAFKIQSFCLIAAILFCCITVFAKSLSTCVYISFYRKGYDWFDGVESSLRNVLEGKCSFIQFDTDTKRNGEHVFILQKAKELIEKSKPDVVIMSDDNAAKFVIQEYFKDSCILFVFCGVNWTAKEYRFPSKNVTGMVEVTPVGKIFELAVSVSGGNCGVFIGDNRLTDRKDLAYFVKYAEKNNIEIESTLVDSVDEWKKQYLVAQEAKDFIILGDNSTIKSWDDKIVKKFQVENSSKLLLTTSRWMMPFSMIGLVIKPEEQGEWSGEAALGVLQGLPIEKISVIANRSWSSWINPGLLGNAGVTLSEEFVEKSQKLDVD